MPGAFIETEAPLLDAPAVASGTKSSRRLADRILHAVHQACDERDFEVARQLLAVFEYMVARGAGGADANRRRAIDGLVAAHTRLWHLRHPPP